MILNFLQNTLDTLYLSKWGFGFKKQTDVEVFRKYPQKPTSWYLSLSLSLYIYIYIYYLYSLLHSHALGSFIDFTVLVQEFTTTVSVHRNESTEYKFRFVLFFIKLLLLVKISDCGPFLHSRQLNVDKKLMQSWRGKGKFLVLLL